jgi:DNA ligase (NAD+)
MYIQKEEFETLLFKLSDIYYNKKLEQRQNKDDQEKKNDGEVSDEVYDSLVNTYNLKFGEEYKSVGCTVPFKNKEILPKYMGSLNKAKSKIEVDRWVKKYPSNYVISNKIDGVSALYSGNKLWTRGNGIEGTNISHILKYLNMPQINKKCFIRGELYMPKSIFNEKYKCHFSNARNMVAGLLNPLTKQPKSDIIRDLVFMAYEYDDKFSYHSMYTQLNIIEGLGFKTPWFKIEKPSKITLEYLTSLMNKQKVISDYDMDGLVIIVDNAQPKSYEKINPPHAIAFKIEGDLIQTTVEYVQWNISKHGFLKPRVKIEKIQLCGVEIKWTTGFNAKFIVDNKIGKGSKLIITRSGDVIPYIKKVISNSDTGKPDMPSDIEYYWNETEVDIILCEENNDLKIRKIAEFFKSLDAKFVGKSTIMKLYNNGYSTIHKIINASVDDLLKINGIKIKGSTRIVDAIKECITNVPLANIASASGCFGIGFGHKKIQSILDYYSNDILLFNDNNRSKEDLIDMIKRVDGINTKTAKRFVNNLDDMRGFLNINSKITIKKEKIKYIFEDKDNDLNGKIIVFTGVRDNKIEEIISNMGGKVTTSVSKKTNILVTAHRFSGSSKEIKADQLRDIDIMTIDEFKLKYI